MGSEMRAALSRLRSVLRFVARVLLIAAVAVLALAAIRWQATLNWLGAYLVCSDPPQSSDLILVMGGDFWGPRVIKAAQLGKAGLAPLVLISGPPYKDRPEGEFAVDLLVSNGYPREQFAVFSHNQRSTIGEVLALKTELARRGAHRVIIVTSSYHSRRCAILFRLFCPGIQFVSVPAADPHYQPQEWWKNDSSRQLFFSEWTKIGGSLLIAYPAYRLTRGS